MSELSKRLKQRASRLACGNPLGSERDAMVGDIEEAAEALEAEQPIRISVKQDGVWIVTKDAMLNLNNIVNAMDAGLIKRNFVNAILDCVP